jgi:hypothetical protein
MSNLVLPNILRIGVDAVKSRAWAKVFARERVPASLHRLRITPIA